MTITEYSTITVLLRGIVEASLVESTTENRSENFRNWISVGNRLTKHEPEAALVAFDEALRIDPTAWGAYNNRALLKYEQGRYADAIDDYNRAISAHPERALLYLNRAGAKLELKLFEASIADYNTAIHLAPEWAGAFARRGGARYKMGQYDLAIQDLSQAIELDAQYAEGYLNRGAVREGNEELEEACMDYDMAIKLDPCLSQAYYGRGNVKSAMGQLEEAIADYSTALSLDPNHAHSYINRGVNKKDLGHPEEAIKDYDRAIDLIGNDSLVYENRGNANSVIGRTILAIKDYDMAIELDPRNSTAYHSRGIEKMKLRQYQSALDDHRQALTIEPKIGEYHASLGICKAELGKGSETLRDLDRAVELEANSANVYYNRGYVRQKRGQYTEAINDYEMAIELEPKAAPVYFARARVWDALGQEDSASKDRKLGQEIWKSDLDSRIARETHGALEGGDSEGMFSAGLARMERVISLFAELLQEPQEENRGQVSVFRFNDENVETAVVLKIFQALSTLSARKLLSEHGFVTEQGMLSRVYQEVIEDILFLVSGVIRGEMSPDHKKYLEEFYRDSFDEKGEVVSARYQWLPRRTIWKYLRKPFKKADSDGKVDDSESEEIQKLLASFHHLSSGYVHARASNIMEMYDGEEKFFQMRGEWNDAGEKKTDVEVLLDSLEMLIGCAACVGKILGGQTWYDCISKIWEDVAGVRNLEG